MLEPFLSMSTQTWDMVSDWSVATRRAEQIFNEHKAILDRVKMFGNKLGRALSPPDFKPGETANIWVGDGLLEIKHGGFGEDGMADLELRWRKSPSAKTVSEYKL